jgi:hypothetical protein
MGKVSSFHLDGIDCWFWSQEHRPPHFHARKKECWEVQVYFLKTKNEMLVMVKSLRGRISSKDANALTNNAERYRAELLKEWEKKVVCNA